MRVPIQKCEGNKSRVAASCSENVTAQSLGQPNHFTGTSGHGTITDPPLEHASDSGLADALNSGCASPATVVDDEGSLILTPSSSICSTTPEGEANHVDSDSWSGEKTVDNVGSANLGGGQPSAGCSRPEAKSLEASDRQGSEGGNGGSGRTRYTVTVEDADEESEASPSLENQGDRTGPHVGDSTIAQATQIPSGTYEQVNVNNSAGITITHNDGISSRAFGATRSNGNAVPTFNSSPFANSFTFRASNPASPRPSSQSYNIFSSNSTGPFTSSSSQGTFINQTLSGCNLTTGARVINCRLSACTGQDLVVTNCSFTSCNFSSSKVTNCNISSSNLTNDKLTNCTLSDSNVLGGSRTNCSWRNSNVN